MEWYVVVDGVQRGPMSKASVARLIELGVVTPNTRARKKDMPSWLLVGHIREFESGHTAQPLNPSESRADLGQIQTKPALFAPNRLPRDKPSILRRLFSRF